MPLGRDGQTLSSYRSILKALHGFYVPLESMIDGVAAQLAPLQWEPRRKAQLLRTDLLALGATDEGIDALPHCQALPTLRGAPEALGCLYVVEGATLGGRVISRGLRRLGISAGSGGRFFDGYGERTGNMWKELMERLRMGEGDPRDEERTVATAVALFESMEHWLQDRGVLE